MIHKKKKKGRDKGIEIEIYEMVSKYKNKEMIEKLKRSLKEDLKEFLEENKISLKFIEKVPKLNYKKIRLVKTSLTFRDISFQLNFGFSVRKKLKEDNKFLQNFSEKFCKNLQKLFLIPVPFVSKKLVSFSREVKSFDGNPQLLLFKSRKFLKRLHRYSNFYSFFFFFVLFFFYFFFLYLF